MSLKKYLLLMFLITLFCWVAWLIVVFYINPEGAGFIGLTLFYLSLFFACLGTFSLLGFFSRVWFSKEQVIFRHLGISTRQSFWFSFLLVVTLMLQSGRYLKWWTVLLMLFLLVSLEFFFLSKRTLRR